MIEFINKHTNGKMLVEESRKNEYLAMGHKLAPEPKPEPKKTPKKKSVKKGD